MEDLNRIARCIPDENFLIRFHITELRPPSFDSFKRAIERDGCGTDLIQELSMSLTFTSVQFAKFGLVQVNDTLPLIRYTYLISIYVGSQVVS